VDLQKVRIDQEFEEKFMRVKREEQAKYERKRQNLIEDRKK